MDMIGTTIANLHNMLGHDKTAYVLGVPLGDKRYCVLCIYEDNPTPENRQRVIDALSPKPQ